MSTPLIRRAITRDVPHITSTWLRCYRHAPFVQGIPNTVYFYNHHKILEEVLPRSMVLVACNPDNPDDIYGWCCYEMTSNAAIVHFVYVKTQHRRQRIAHRLVEMIEGHENPSAYVYTHRTPLVKKILREAQLPKSWVYNPYTLFDSLPEGWSSDEKD